MDMWIINHKQFEARIDVTQIGELPVSQVRKLFKLAREADNFDCLRSFGPLFGKAQSKALEQLEEVTHSPPTRILGCDKMPSYYDTFKKQDALRRTLISNQKRVCARLNKIKSIYEKELMNYEY